jgi:hypothetical protein
VGDQVSFTKYYNEEDRKSTTASFNIIGEVTAIQDVQTEDGILLVLIVTAKNLEHYYVLPENYTSVNEVES